MTTDPIGADHPINADLEADYYQQRGFGPGRPTTPDPLRAALEQAYDLLTMMDKQALNPGPDHLVAVTVETWRDSIRPVIARIRAALAADTAPLDARLAECLDDAIHDLMGGDLAGGLLAVRVARERLAFVGRYSEADRQAAYKAGWDDARAVIAEPLDVERLARAMHPVWMEDTPETRPDTLSQREWAQMLLNVSIRRADAIRDAERIAAEYVRLAKERDQG